MANTVVVTIWNYGSEASYVFGPFTENGAETFISKLPAHIEVTSVEILNAPELMGTGKEVRYG